ncbi:MAG: class I SAM-dependent RNA methyltransferase [bacterium]|nr:class I SAM-dependent RNA methyltransferase [bacterium]MDT8395227.1 class I SAM-dependent RNA methyltransferase [bacterium]
MNKPVSSKCKVLIEKLVSGGDGLGHLDGYPVFVPLTAPGDVVIPKEVRKARGVLFARDSSVISRSGERREAPCPWFGKCGGCQWMHLPYPAQLQWKRTVYSETVGRIAGLPEVVPVKVHSSPAEFGYRHRIRLKYDGKRFGFYRRSSRAVVSWEKCLLLPDLLNRTVEVLREALDGRGVDGRLRDLELAADPAAESMTAMWVFEPGRRRSMGSAVLDNVESALLSAGIPLAGQGVSIANRGKVVADRGGGLHFKVRGKPVKASPGTFLQVNPAVNEILVERVEHHLGPGDGRLLLDLYCGNGNLSIPAAAAGFRVLGVESSPGAVRDAMDAAPDGCRFVTADAAEYLSGSFDRWDVVVADPPRTGLPAPLVEKLARISPPLIVYVSCEPATLARDLARLTAAGYGIRTMELLDMFPQTSHVESITVLELGL